MWKQLIACLLLSLLLMGCIGPSSPPLINLDVDGEIIEGFQSSYCWKQRLGPGICVDTIEPVFNGALPLPVGEPIRLQLDRPLPDGVTLALSEEVFGDAVVVETVTPAQAIAWSPTVAPGAYILAASGAWPEGNVTYWFSISFE
jgi:hypothetical protein